MTKDAEGRPPEEPGGEVPMPDNDRIEKRGSRALDWFKAFSGFLGSVVLGASALIGTNCYNERQLEISRNKELSELVPQLGDSLASKRKFAAISLALYGKYAVAPLMPVLGDEDEAVRQASARSLSLIGNPAIGALDSAFADTRNSPLLRGFAIKTLALMRDAGVYERAARALHNLSEPSEVRAWAAYSIGIAKETRGGALLVEVLKRRVALPGDNLRYAIYSLSDIEYAPADTIISSILLDPRESGPNRVAAAWALAHIGTRFCMGALTTASRSARPDSIRTHAANALDWARFEGKPADGTLVTN